MYDELAIVTVVCGILLQAVFILCEHRKKMVAAVCLKGSASLMFVFLGLIGFSLARVAGVYYPEEYSLAKFVVIGLVLGLVGDVMLNLRHLAGKYNQKVFLVGILFFLAGHIMYLTALIPSSANFWLCFAIGAVLTVGLLIYIFNTMSVKLSFKIFGAVYLGAVIIMTVIAIGIAIASPFTHTIMYAIGAVLFTASDIVLIFNTFGGSEKFALRITNLSLYYVGQLLIAGSLYFIF